MKYDVIVLGGGFVGHALRIACTKLGLSVCLVDAKPPVHTPTTDGRAIALSYTSVLLLEKLDVWQDIALHATPIETVQVSAQGRLGTLRFKAKDLNIPYLGQVVPAPLLGKALVEKYADQATKMPFSAVNLRVDADHIQVELDNNDILTTSLTLACDGTASFCRDYFRMECEQTLSNKKALVVGVSLEKPLGTCAFQRLTKQGVCAMLPLQGNKATVVLSMKEDDADHVNGLSDAAFLMILNEIWGGRFGEIKIEGKRFSYPLQHIYVRHPIAERVILMGNAAHTLNPIAAQGLNLALRDIAKLYDILEDAKALKQDLGNNVPKIYCDRIQSSHERMERITDYLVNLSYADYLSPLRGIGLTLLQHAPFIRNKCARMFAGM